MEHSQTYNELMEQINQLVSSPRQSEKKFISIIIDLFGEQINEEFEVDFSDEQVNLLIKYKCSITRTTPEKKQFFSRDTILSLISLLIDVIMLINSFLPNEEQQKQTQLLQQEVAELREESNALNELVDLLKNKATPDQIQ